MENITPFLVTTTLAMVMIGSTTVERLARHATHISKLSNRVPRNTSRELLCRMARQPRSCQRRRCLAGLLALSPLPHARVHALHLGLQDRGGPLDS